MSWNYSHNPSNSAKDEVRFLIGDTNSKDPLLHDEEIEYLLKKYNNYPLNAAQRGCEMVVAKFSRLADETVGSVSKSFSQKATAYRNLGNDLRLRIGIEGSKPYAGGISVSDKEMNNLNTDLVNPEFTKHQFENTQVAPWTSDSDYDEAKRGGL
jgi:hypothetical protein